MEHPIKTKEHINFVNILLWTLLSLFFIRVYECVINSDYFDDWQYLLSGFVYDVGYCLRFFFFLIIPFFIGTIFSSKVTGVVTRLLIFIVLFLSVVLVTFYAIAGFPLDTVVFIYSFKEIVSIVSSSQSIPLSDIFIIVAIPCFFLFFSSKKIIANSNFCIATLSISILGALWPQPQPLGFVQIEKYYLVENKIVYMLKSLKNVPTISHEMDEQQIKFYSTNVQEKFSNQKFVNEKCPFLHLDQSPDVLSPFFKMSKKKPNVVLIIVEGLGREYSGENSIVPSTTPFIDSLASNGLTWTNCLSTSQRTICALPSIIGALPFGKTGFMNYKESAPNFNSLYTIMKANGYTTSFFYGGWLCFDDMCHFLKLNKVDNYIDVSLKDSIGRKNSWGLYDDFLFQNAVSSITFDENPRFEVYLTLTTHDPFEYPEQEKYIKQYENIIKDRKITGEQKKQIREYASFLYLDESVKKLLDAYKLKTGFENTIFIITGDHNFHTGQDPMVSHHVPLIIWSPLLSRKKQMNALVSHRDISPSLLAFLKNRYQLKTPDVESFLNVGLDTSVNFQSNTFSPLMDVGRHLYGLVYKDMFFYLNQTFQILYKENHLSLVKVKDTIDMAAFINAYKNLDIYVCENNLLIDEEVPNLFRQDVYTISSNKDMADFIKHYPNIEQKNSFGKKVTFFSQNQEFPLKILTDTIQDNIMALEFNLKSNFFIPSISNKKENSKELSFITEINRGDKQFYWANENLNDSWFAGYNKWFEFKTKKVIQKEKYQFQSGDIITFYFWNKGRRTFYFSDFETSLISYTKCDSLNNSK